MATKKAAADPLTKKPLKIKVIGTGGIGLCLLPTLCRYLNYNGEKYPAVEISLIDGDSFEERNRERQDFVEVGPKASMTAAEYRGKFPRLMFWDHPVYVADNNVIQLIRENDIVLLCVDNHKTRKLISERAEELKNVTVISGGNDWTDGNVLVHIRRDEKNLTPPLANKYHPEIMNPTDKNPAEVEQKAEGCNELAVSEPQLLITNNYIAANMLAALFNLVDEKQYEKVLAAPHNYAELYCDLTVLKTLPRERKV
jgi:molybdopterin/thiamine biosynthesis adenylyltransferase